MVFNLLCVYLRGYKMHFSGDTCPVPAHKPLSQESIPSSSNTPVTYMNVFMRKYTHIPMCCSAMECECIVCTTRCTYVAIRHCSSLLRSSPSFPPFRPVILSLPSPLPPLYWLPMSRNLVLPHFIPSFSLPIKNLLMRKSNI